MFKCLSVAVGVLISTICFPAEAQPLRFNYQAKLTDTNGTPLEGTHQLYFTIYQGGTANSPDSGVALFSEQTSMTLNDGVVSHAVGTGDSQVPGPLADEMFDGVDVLYLQVAVDTAGNVVLPRTRLESVPFAIAARRAATADTAGNGVPAGATILTESPVAPDGYTATGKALLSANAFRSKMPTGRYAASAATLGNAIYVMGGSAQAANEVYYPATNTWVTTGAALSPGRDSHGSGTIDSYVYVAGGLTGGPAANTVSRYDTVLNSWEPRQVMLTGRAYFGAAVSGNQFYAIGGLDSAGAPTALGEVYTQATNTWAPIAAMPGGGREGCAAAAMGGKIYVIGGSPNGLTLTGLNEIYDIASNTWTTGAPIPVPLYAPACIAVDGKIHVLGGFDSLIVDSDQHHVYDPQTDAWSTGVGLPQPCSYPAAVNFANQIFLFGGKVGATTSNRTTEINPTRLFLHVK